VSTDETWDRVMSLKAEYGRVVYGISMRFTGEKSEAEDVYQEAWLRIFEILPRKNPTLPMRGWLCGVTVNVARDYLRRRYRWRDPRGGLWQRMIAAVSADENALPVGTNATRTLWGAVDSLSARQREIFTLYELDDLSTQDIANRLGVAEGTVKATIHQTRKLLRSKVAPLESLWMKGEL
jgi:RNA polymerase sigma-70 factor (ECF subfamily)